MQEQPKNLSGNPYYKNPQLQKRAEHKIREAMFALREETGCDLTYCHQAMLVGCFNVMKTFCVDEAMFNNMYEGTMTAIAQVFENMKKQTHENPGGIQ